eukprot:11927240-Ditylum_brightwellii.AAC.1
MAIYSAVSPSDGIMLHKGSTGTVQTSAKTKPGACPTWLCQTTIQARPTDGATQTTVARIQQAGGNKNSASARNTTLLCQSS